ncbi:MAG: hypothetical protein ACLP8A_01855 [Methylovirgula sp.]
MLRAPIVFGAFLLIGVPLAAQALPPLVDRLALDAEWAQIGRRVPGLHVSAFHIDPAQSTLTLEGVSLKTSGNELKIGWLTVPLANQRHHDLAFVQTAAAADKVPSADAQLPGGDASGAISADNVIIDTPDVQIVIAHIHFDGTNLSKADFDAIIDPKSTTPVVERLAKISATHVAIPQATIATKPTLTGAGQDAKITLRDVAIDNLAQGRAGFVIIGATSGVMHSPGAEEMQAGLGLIRMKGLDLVQLARVISGPLPMAEPAHALCDSLGVDGGRIISPNANSELGVESLSIKDIKTRGNSGVPDAKAGTPDAKAAAPSTFVRILSSIEVGSLDFSDLHFTTANSEPWHAKIGKGSMAQVGVGRISQARFDTIAVAGPDAAVQIGHIGWQGLNFGLAREFLGYSPTKPDANAPAGLQNVAIDAAVLDLTSAAKNPAPDSPTHFELSHAELVSSAPASSIPTRLAAAFDHFTFDLKNVNAKSPEIAALGYGKVDLSSRLQLHMDNDYSELGLDTFSLNGADMGSVHVSGFLDHLSKAIFGTDPTENKNALLNVVLRHLEVRIENAGLFERAVAAEAKRSSTTPDGVRKNLIAAVKEGLPKALGQGRDTDLVLAALVKFINAPKNFRLSILAPQGLGAFDAALLKEPEALQQKIDIEVMAND